MFDDEGAGRKKAVSSAPPIASLAFVAPRVAHVRHATAVIATLPSRVLTFYFMNVVYTRLVLRA